MPMSIAEDKRKTTPLYKDFYDRDVPEDHPDGNGHAVLFNRHADCGRHLVCVDADSRAIQDFYDDLFSGEDVCTVRTTSGKHYYMLAEPGQKSERDIRWLPYTDYLAGRTFGICRSDHPAHPRKWNGVPLGPAPAALSDLLTKGSAWAETERFLKLRRTRIRRGGRNTWLVRQAGSLYGIHYFEGALLKAALTHLVAEYCDGADDDDWPAAIDGIVAQTPKWEQSPRRSFDVFDRTDYLRDLRQYAESVGLNPFALLAACMARASMSVSWQVRLYSEQRAKSAQPGLYTAIFGPSSAGKSQAVEATDDLMEYPRQVLYPYAGELASKPGKDAGENRRSQVTFTPTSGQGISSFLEGVHDRETDNPKREIRKTSKRRMYKLQSAYTYNAMIHFDEVDRFTASRAYTDTLCSDLKSAFMGGQLSSHASQVDRRRMVRKGFYTLSAAICGTDDHMIAVWNETSGLRQRILFMDARRSSRADIPDRPQMEKVKFDRWHTPSVLRKHCDHVRVGDHHEYRVREHGKLGKLEHQMVLAGTLEEGQEPPDFCRDFYIGGHTLIVLRKVAFALSLLHQRPKMRISRQDIDIGIEVLKESKRSGRVLDAHSELVRQQELRTYADRAVAAHSAVEGSKEDRDVADIEKYVARFDRFKGTGGAWQAMRGTLVAKSRGKDWCEEQFNLLKGQQ